MARREKKRDVKEFDTTQLKIGGHGKSLHRDYSAHFFRWSFARRYITSKDSVLEVGCGEEKPLYRILTGGAAAHVKQYVGVDLNKLKPSNAKKITFYGEFDFTSRYEELIEEFGGFDVCVNYEVIEHMPVEDGKKLLKGMFNCLRRGGTLLLSTPCYDGKRHAANHIHEYYVGELQGYIEEAGFEVIDRFGTFMDIKHIGRAESTRASKEAIEEVSNALKAYFDNDAISNIFGPLYEDSSRNNLWVCRKPQRHERKRKYKQMELLPWE